MKTSKPYTLLNKTEPYLWILPSIILMSIFIIIPIGFVFRMSVSKITKAGLIKGFIGLENFEKVNKNKDKSMFLNKILFCKKIVYLLKLK